MSVNFVDYFANEHNGYDILYQNMKYGLIASKELSEYLRERSNIEETNSKSLAKLAKQANGNCAQGTFAPFWSVLKCSAEKLSNLHQHMFQKVGELVKDVARYADELHKKHKAVKDSESSTLEVVLLIQNTKQALQKAKDVYTTKSAEFEKLRKDNASAKDLEKAEVKLKKLHEDYWQLAEKYNLVKQDFEKKMSQTCKHFQDVEEAHLKQMKQFVNVYADIIQNNHDMMGQVHRDFKHQCLELTVEKLLEQFLIEKYTSIEKAVLVELPPTLPKPGSANNSISEADQISTVSNGSHKPTQPGKAPKKEPSFATKTSRRTTSLLNLFTPNFQSKDEPTVNIEGAAPCSAPSSPSGTPAIPVAPDKEDNMGRTTLRESKWFLRSKRTKPKQKKSKKKKDDNSMNSTADKSDFEEKQEETPIKEDLINSPEVDEEGFCIRPKEEKGSVYSSSDSDSEEEREQKIHVEIKPITNGSAPMSASVDELRATVENISLYKIGTTRRGSNVNTSKASNDLVGLDFFPSPTVSNPTSPQANVSNPYAPLQGNQSHVFESPTPISNTEVGDLFSEVGEMSQSNIRTSTPTISTISLPRPPSRRSDGEFRTAGSTGSRGPSPLTIGMADTIPLAVAFHEIIHSYFRGTEESKCQVKMSGDMMLSFPTGIVGVLANNPNPAKLCFRLKNIHRLETVLPNKQLVTINQSTSTRDTTVVDFNMPALTSLLKRQSEKNPTAQYFNVDILKYQIRPKTGASSCPFQLVSYWKCEKDHTDLKVDYKYNMHAMSPPSPLLNVSVCVPVNGSVKNVIAMPKNIWNEETEQALWRFTELSQHSEDRGVGSLRARFELNKGPSSKATLSSQFNCEGATLSGIEFELIGGGYRLSLVKRRFVSGKYICDSEMN
ncbi:F-BAR domain only protein 2 [Bombyx mandarina]|uniref:F-BAR domain only protein 2 n=2 Tax=Bombyx TaxID=7090 RepID=A0A8R2DM90_BOMMO|nr:F-BAR domain only protein 2 [Bombyx mori]XP_028031900.1 F-BAR domain only protein 2 [Bombyx mandarina]